MSALIRVALIDIHGQVTFVDIPRPKTQFLRKLSTDYIDARLVELGHKVGVYNSMRTADIAEDVNYVARVTDSHRVLGDVCAVDQLKDAEFFAFVE